MTTHCYINRQSSQVYVLAILRVTEVIHIACNMGARDFPDMYDLSPRVCSPQASAYISGKSLAATLHILLVTLYRCPFYSSNGCQFIEIGHIYMYILYAYNYVIHTHTCNAYIMQTIIMLYVCIVYSICNSLLCGSEENEIHCLFVL